MGSRALGWLIRHRWPALLLIDLIALQITFSLTYTLRFDTGMFTNPLRPDFAPVALALSLYWIILFALLGVYNRKVSTSRYEAILELVKPILIGLAILFLQSMDTGDPFSSSRLVLATYGLLLLLTTGSAHIFFRTLIRWAYRRRIGLYRSLVIGYGKRGQDLVKALSVRPIFGHTVQAVVYGEADEVPSGDIPSYPLEKLEELLEGPLGEGLEYVLVALEPEQRESALEIVDRVHRYSLHVMIVPDFFQILVGLAKSRELYGVPLLEVFPDLLDPTSRLIKRTMDIAAGIVMLTIGVPLFLLIALAIKIDSKGPILYKQKRIGYRWKEFTLVKFRSMYVDAEKKTGAVWASEDDPRITRVGKFLRSSRLDELPQAWNILTGSMSLVGPRPERKVFVEEFVKQIPFYSRRLNVKPGITGWAQVRRGYDTSLDDVKDKLQYDLFYLENLSIGLDIKILLNTIWVMFTGRGQ